MKSRTIVGRCAAACAALALTVAGCGEGAPSGGTSAAPTASAGAATSPPVASVTTAPPATSSTTAARCAIGPQSPSRGTLAAAYPTALEVAPDGRLFYTERAGTVRVVQDGSARVFAQVATVTVERGGGYSERGLLGLALSPTFARDRFVYAFYSKADDARQEVIRWTDCAGTGIDPTPLVELPAGADCCHKGGRLAFGPDGKLYVTLGEEHTAAAAQDRSDVRGKVLRYNPDGSVPPDNPFGAGNPVWAYGFRNPFGLAFSAAGQMAVTNNGPSGDAGSPGTGYDTVITSVARGGGYQWPNCYGYSHPLASSTCGAGQIGPDWSSETETVVPTGAAFIDGSGPAGLAGHLVFCTFDRGMEILSPGTPHASVAAGPSGCRLDVVQAPDHGVYYSDTGHIYRQG